MTLEDLRIFVSAVEAGSMSALARSLGCTQPAVAHHIRRLEQELGTPLLERSRLGITATVAGSALYERATTALAAISTAETEVAELRGKFDGALAIAASSGMVRHLLKPTIVDLRRSRPAVDFRLACSNTLEEQCVAVRERRADLAFVGDWPGSGSFDYCHAIEIPYSLVVHRDDPMAQRKRIRLERIPEMQLVTVGEASTIATFVQARLANRSLSLTPAHVVDTDGTAVLYVELGLGQAMLPTVQASTLARRAELRTIPVSGLPAVPFGWIARDFGMLSSAAKEFLSLFGKRVGHARS